MQNQGIPTGGCPQFCCYYAGCTRSLGGPLKHAVLSYSFVGVWATPLPGMPKMDPNVLKNLFGDPYATNIGFAQDGSLVIQRMMKPPAPMVMFGPLRFQVQCPSLEELTKAFGMVRQEAYTRTNQAIPLLSQLGLNTEHEWTRPSLKPSNRWLAERYVRRGLFQPPLDIDVKAQTINFVLALSNPARQYNIQLQPRADREDTVFAAINDHREWHKAVPAMEEVAALLKESANEIDVTLTPLILGGVAENA